MNIQILTLIALAIFGVYALCVSVLELAHALFRQPMIMHEQYIDIDGCRFKTGNKMGFPKGDYPKTTQLKPLDCGGYYGVEVGPYTHECGEKSVVHLFWLEQQQ